MAGDAAGDHEIVSAHIFEHDVVFDEFLVFLFGHFIWMAWGQGIVITAEFWVFNQSSEDWFHAKFHVYPVLFRHGAGQGEVF